MNKKYQIDTEENQQYLKEMAEELLKFGLKWPSEEGNSYYLGDDGTPWTDRNRETWITCRMTHVYSMGKMLNQDGSIELVESGIKGLLGQLKDKKNGGWFPGVTPMGEPLDGKQGYAHAFVMLAASSASLVGANRSEELLREAIGTFDKYFWDEQEGLSRDTWNTEFTECDSYRGVNCNMHTVEAFLAVTDATGDMKYRKRAGRIIDRVVDWSKANNWRIPEHFTEDWQPDYEMNKERPDDPFKPYGATPGHGIEWARLITQWATATYGAEADETKKYIQYAENLFNTAVNDGWWADGKKGIVYTTGWDGRPVVRDRMHWTLAEAINSAAVLYRVTGNARYADLYSEFLQYLDETVHDKKNGSWFHQLDENNQLKGTVWPGKSDIYHALQSMLIPYMPVDVSVAKAVYQSKR